mmetsp:Transcript_5973/g.13693  ORF Transcript_5973/g.13693 Transcript_5973/m.13693 type:complete len:157 (-) Transcript_5973:1350-1820(-)
MKLVILLSLASGTSSFVSKSPAEVTTELSAITRRKAITLSSGLLFGALAGPRPSHSSTANPVFEDEINYEPSQQAHGDLLDVNNAFVVDYKQYPGMYPTAAGKIASHGPYNNVKDIYDIPGVTEHDKYIFKRYETEMTALPPGRMFDERINQRQST